MSEKNCPICNNVSSSYMGNYRRDGLCRIHTKEFKAGLIVQCLKCNTWHNVDEICECEKKIPEKYTRLPLEGFNRCVICDEFTMGYAFCYNCYKEHTIEEMLNILNGETKVIEKNEIIETDNIEIVKDEIIETGNIEIVKDEIIETNTIETVKDKIIETNNIEIVKDEIIETNTIETLKKENTDVLINEEENFKNEIIIIDSENKSRCITCGKKTDGLLFCASCYYKYNNKTLLFKINNCSEVYLLDESYEGLYKCKDGHLVKSKSELLIDNYLFEHNIQHSYEKEYVYGKNPRDIITPDFYLPNYLGMKEDVYIEHWGYDESNYKYWKSKKFKHGIYLRDEVTLINTFEKKDAKDFDTALDRKLNKKHINKNKINFPTDND